jgi:ABC-type transport system involved in cytochrome c biogenesis permease subunit
MLNLLESALLIVTALAAIAVGLATVWQSRRGGVVSLSRMSNRVITRRDNPAAFWTTVGMGIFWTLFGGALLLIPIGQLIDL